MKFDVRSCTEEEYRKADLDSSYVPKEYKAGEIEAESESQARRKLKLYILAGKFPKGSDIV